MDKSATGTRFVSILFISLLIAGCATGPILTSTPSEALSQTTAVNMLDQQKIAGKSTIDKDAQKETAKTSAETTTAPATQSSVETDDEQPVEESADAIVEEVATIIDTNLGIAEEHLPKPGSCRIWYLEKSAADQPAAKSNCKRVQKHMPAGAILLYRPLVNSEYVEVCHFDANKREVVKMVRFYLAATGELKREERF
ncbi:MAG: hypothetical protein ACRBF0_12705 [Calditrichia bacterium]